VSEQRIAAEDLTAAVRIHADRVHDFLRRLGCEPRAAVDVVEASALDLVETAGSTPKQVTDVVGWWFGRARAIGATVAGGSSGVPLGGGLLSVDVDQQRIAEALEQLPERERVAVLLRDAYALPAASVGVALGTDADAAMETVGRGRLRFLQTVGDDLPSTGGHPVELGALARLGMGGPVAARDATPRRHAQSCATCRSIWDAQERAHRLLAGLTVVALPDVERDGLLGRVEQHAQAALPAGALLLLEEEDELEDERPSRLLIPLYVLAGVFLAAVLGVVIGVLASRDGESRATGASDSSDPGILPPVVAPPAPSRSPVPSPVLSSAPLPSPRVFTLPPSPSPVPASPSAAVSTAPEPAVEPQSLTSDPTSGPNGQTVTVQGAGWMPGSTVQLDYRNSVGSTGSRAQAVVDSRGRFTTTIAAQDPANFPGRHVIRASNGIDPTMETPYDVSG
jgi:hypothetical protein